MKKKALITLASVFALLAASGQSKVNTQGLLMLQNYETEQANRARGIKDAATVAEEQSAIVRLNPGYTSATIAEMGFEVNTDLGSIITITLPLNRVAELSESEAVKSISFGGKQTVSMNFARAAAGVDDIHSGFTTETETVSFDGTGVVTGMFDTGFDANHVNFNDASGASRIGALWHYTGSTGNSEVTKYDSSNISEFTTDNSAESHATHVAGIMAGSHNSILKYMNVASPTTIVSTDKQTFGKNPFYGVAPRATIAVGVGSLYDANIIDGVSNIIDYAEENGMPCVINLSLGSTIGPHDGTDDYTVALSELGKRAIIVMAAGNDGGSPVSMSKAFSATDTELKTMLNGNSGTGYVDIWGKDNTELEVSWGVYDTETQMVTTLLSTTYGSAIAINLSNSAFSSAFSGQIQMISGVDVNNNRYNATCYVDVTPKATNTTKMLALVIEGGAGQSCDVYGHLVSFYGQGLDGWADGTPDNSISSACCGDNLLSVGAFATRTHWLTLGGNGYYSPSFVYKNICPFSSYGTTFAGDAKPMVSAPGGQIVSSFSRYYVAAADASTAMVGQTTGTDVNYWGVNSGTSMACPFVTGTVALWLQADPTLTFDDVVEVINATSASDVYTKASPNRFGAGKIDALAGIKKVLDDKASVGAILADEDRNFMMTPVDGGYNVYVAGESSLIVTVYDATGRAVSVASAAGNTVDVATEQLTPGVYVVAAQGTTQRHTAKIAVK